MEMFNFDESFISAKKVAETKGGNHIYSDGNIVNYVTGYDRKREERLKPVWQR